MKKSLSAYSLTTALSAMMSLLLASDIHAASLAAAALDAVSSVALTEEPGTAHTPAVVPVEETNSEQAAAGGMRPGMRRSGTSPFAARRSARLAPQTPATPAATPETEEGADVLSPSMLSPAPAPAPAPSRRFGARFAAGQAKPQPGVEGEINPQEGGNVPAPQRRFNLGLNLGGKNKPQSQPSPYGINTNGANAGADAINAPNATVYQPTPFKNFRALMRAPRPYLGYDPHVQPAPYMTAPAGK